MRLENDNYSYYRFFARLQLFHLDQVEARKWAPVLKDLLIYNEDFIENYVQSGLNWKLPSFPLRFLCLCS